MISVDSLKHLMDGDVSWQDEYHFYLSIKYDWYQNICFQVYEIPN